MHSVFRLLFVFGIAVSMTSTAHTQVQNHVTEGNLRPTQNPGCIKIAVAQNNLTPADLALGVIACVKKRKFQNAAEMFLLLRARATFDTKRVADRTAHQAGKVISLQIGQSIRKSQLKQFSAAYQTLVNEGSPQKSAICQDLYALGAPDYFPAYMIAHGMDAFTESNESPLIKNFKPAATWRDILRTNVKCP